MQFVIDENIPKELISWLETKGHGVIVVPKGTPDEGVAKIAKAKEEGGVLLTLNRHFSNTLRFPPKDFPGIVRIKIHPSFIEDIILSLERLLQTFFHQKDFQGKLLILEKYGFFKLRK